MKRTAHLLALQPRTVFGHLGNSATVFAVQRIGVNVWPLDTARFGSHAQAVQGDGEILAAQQITALIEGIAGIGELGQCDAVLSGWPCNAAQGQAIVHGVARVRSANPRALYLCDPLLGHPQPDTAWSPETGRFLHEASTVADYLCLDSRALEGFCARQARSLSDCLGMARHLLEQGPHAVLVKDVQYPGKPADSVGMLLVSAAGNWYLNRPLLAFPHQPPGSGDLTSGLFLARILLGDTPVAAFEFAAAAVHEVLLETHASGRCELELVRAQDRIAHPRVRFEAKPIV